MKTDMRFFLVAALVSTAYAALETCADTDGDASVNTDAYVCADDGYSALASPGDIDISAAVGDDAAIKALCCGADTNSVTPTNFGLIANSNYAAAVDVTTDVALADFACDAGYTIATLADGTTPITITLSTPDAANSGAFTTTSDTDSAVTAAATCVADTNTVTPGGLGVIANSNYAAAVDVTTGVALADFACDNGFSVAKLADGTTDIAITFTTPVAATGAFDISSDTDSAVTAAATCVADTAEEDGAGDGAAEEDGAGDGAAEDGSAADGSAAADGSTADGSAGSADESAASPAALAAAGMAAIALLL